MKNKENRMFMLLSIAVMMFLSLATTQVQAQTFSGQAVGTQSTTTVQVGAAGTPVVTAVAGARIADTGALDTTTTTPPTRTAGPLVAAGVALGTAPVTGTLTATAIETMTSGGNGTSQSQARVAGLNLNVGGTLGNNTITADAITTNTNCVCTTAGATCSGTTNVVNLNITLSNGTVIGTLNGTVAPNTTFTATTSAGGVGNRVVTTTTIVLNEQTRAPNDNNAATDDITVNGLRITVTESAVVAGVTTTTTSTTIIAQAHSDIKCDGTISPTAASATIGGRVTASKGRGLSKASVVLTGLDGQTRYALTNSRGYFSFSEVESGMSYIVDVRSKRYTYASRSVFVTEDLVDVDFEPTP